MRRLSHRTDCYNLGVNTRFLSLFVTLLGVAFAAAIVGAAPATAQQQRASGQLIISIDEQLAIDDPKSGGVVASILSDNGDLTTVPPPLVMSAGARSGDRVTLAGTESEFARGGGDLIVAQRAPTSRAIDAEHDLAVILVDLTDNPEDRPFDRAEVADRVFSNTGGINGVLLQSSGGAVRFDGDINDVYGWYTTLKPPLTGQCNAQIENSFVRNFLVAEAIPVEQYEHLFFVLVCDNKSVGLSTLGSVEIAVGDQTCSCSSAFLGYDAYKWEYEFWPNQHGAIRPTGANVLPWLEAVGGHELGHGFGAWHDSYFECGESSWGTADDCVSGNYGNHFSVMGRGRGIAWTYSAAARDRVGFFADGDLIDVSSDGSVVIGPLNGDSSGRPLAAAVIDPSTGERRHYIELRTPSGFDADLALGPPGNEVMVTTAVAPVNGTSLVVDGQPNGPSAPWNDRDQVGFLEGTGFTDDLGITVTVESIAADHAVLSFDFPEVPVSDSIADVDCDGVTTVTDAAFALQMAVGLRSDSGGCPLGDPLSEANAVAADANNDDNVTVVDASLILQCAVGIANAVCSP